MVMLTTSPKTVHTVHCVTYVKTTHMVPVTVYVKKTYAVTLTTYVGKTHMPFAAVFLRQSTIARPHFNLRDPPSG